MAFGQLELFENFEQVSLDCWLLYSSEFIIIVCFIIIYNYSVIMIIGTGGKKSYNNNNYIFL